MEHSIRRRSYRIHILLNRIKNLYHQAAERLIAAAGYYFNCVDHRADDLYFRGYGFLFTGARWTRIIPGLRKAIPLYNWKDLLFGRMSQINLWTPLLNSMLLSVFSCVFRHPVRWHICVSGYAYQSYQPQIPKLNFYISLYNAAVDAGCRVAERVFQQRGNGYVGRPSGCPVQYTHAGVVVHRPIPKRGRTWAALRAVCLYSHWRHLPKHGC